MTIRTEVEIPDELISDVADVAKIRGMTINELIVDILRREFTAQKIDRGDDETSGEEQ